MKKKFNLIWIYSCILIMPVVCQAFDQWPDTGQTYSYTDTFGEDSDYSGIQPSYTKLGSGGVELSDTATASSGWMMIKDNVTGLIWEIKTNDGSINDKDDTYTWDNANNFITTLNNENFSGFSDWRLPTIKELSTIVNSEAYNPCINKTFFPNTVSSNYWSSTYSAFTNTFIWYLDFNTGNESHSGKSISYYVRAVRAGQSNSSSDFIDNGDGTVTDTSTGLMWQQDTPADTYDWNSAIEYCEDLSFAGYSDWRLPNINELKSIVDFSKATLSIDTDFFLFTVSSSYWSSTAIIYHPTYIGWAVSFASGGRQGNMTAVPPTFYVRAVRAGQSESSDNQDNTSTTGYTQADWDAAKEEGRQECISDPSSCGISTGGSTSCGSGDSITIQSDLSFSFDAIYSTLLGDLNLETNFKFFGDQGGKLLWELENYTVK